MSTMSRRPPVGGSPDADAPVVQLSARQVAWRRRRDSAGRSWREFRRHKAGVFGLCVLVVFALVAIFAPVLASPDGLEVTKATGPVLGPPSSAYLYYTDEHKNWSDPLAVTIKPKSE